MQLKDIAENITQHSTVKMEAAAPATSYITNGLVFSWGAMTFNEVMMLIGAVLAVATYITNLYFQRKRDKREHELHVKNMQSKLMAEISKRAPPQDP